jgi:hypothetical protein
MCAALPEVTERLSHGEATWFILEKRSFVSMADHHHDERVAVTFAAAENVQETLIASDPARYFRPAYVGSRGWVGAYLDGSSTTDRPDWDAINELIVDAWRLVAPDRLVRQHEEN